jgi:predicted metal-binding membrane protein
MTQAATIQPVRALVRPKLIAIACVAMLVAAGWGYLGLVLAGESSGGLIGALCRPIHGFAGASGTGFVLTFTMWSAMVLAMMLPTAAPMIVTYADLVATAAAKSEPAASPVVLIAGYVMVWLGGALLLTAVQGLLARLGALDDLLSVASPWLAAALFLIAGLYQFSSLKHACLTHCQHPFRFFFANWTADPRGVLRLGARQGLYCMGCCWAMMLLMFAIGVMSVLWMAALGVVMAAEKISTMRISRAIGVIWLVIGVAILAGQLVEYWKTV